MGGPALEHFDDEDGMLPVGQLLRLCIQGKWKICQICSVDFYEHDFPYTLRFQDSGVQIQARLDIPAGRCFSPSGAFPFRPAENEDEASVDEVITDILGDNKLDLTDGQLVGFARRAADVFHREHALLKIPCGPRGVLIFGDLHGNFRALQDLLSACGSSPPETTLLFLGDYVDRGSQSLEVLTLLIAWKVKYPSRVFMLRGNHEDRDINAHYGFMKECKERGKLNLYNHFVTMFSYMPLAAVVGDKLFCAHGGIGPSMPNLSAVIGLDIHKPLKIPHQATEAWEQVIQDLTWADPGQLNGPRADEVFDARGFCFNSSRNCSVKWSPVATEAFLAATGLSLIVRGHECVDGFRLSHGGKVVTLFSTNSYGDGRNGAAAMHFGGNISDIRFFKIDADFKDVSGRQPSWATAHILAR